MYALVFVSVVIMVGIHISQEIFLIDMFAALRPFLEHDRKHVLRLLRLFGARLYAWFPLDRNPIV